MSHLFTHALLCTAFAAKRMGISVVPILSDGTKRPPFRWKSYQHQQAATSEILSWFCRFRGIAAITGTISGGLEALDFDTVTVYQRWSERIIQQGFKRLHLRLTTGYLEASPSGIHLLYRCRQIEGNQKLASLPASGAQRTLIETRGEGGLVVIAPSSGGVHHSQKPYVLLRGGLSTIQTITPSERQTLFSVARTFHEVPLPVPASVVSAPLPFPVSSPSVSGLRPGDCYNLFATWEEVFVPHGWKLLSTSRGESYWQRPGKEGPGISATTNYAGTDRLWVFSTATLFDVTRSYDKFGAYTVLNHSGDFSSAARELARRGSPASRFSHEKGSRHV